MRASQIICCALFVLGSLLHAKADDDIVIPSTATPVKHDFAASCQVGNHTFVFEKTTLADVIRILGSGKITRPKTKNVNFDLLVEYVDGNNLIRFTSNNEMGGDTHDLGGVEISPIRDGEKTAGLPRLHDPVRFSFGTCGMSFVELRSKLGATIFQSGSAWYRYSGKTKRILSRGVTDYDVTGILKVKVVRDKVTEMKVWHVTSS